MDDQVKHGVGAFLWLVGCFLVAEIIGGFIHAFIFKAMGMKMDGKEQQK